MPVLVVNKFKLTKTQFAKRPEKVEYVGRDANYRTNLKHVLKEFFK